jgi:hypothetical protein
LIEVSAAYHLYARHWIATFVAFGASLGAHLATFTTFLCVAYAFDVPSAFPEGVKVLDFFAVLPIERTITALPISFAGLGLREQILQVMLHDVCHASVAVSKLIGTMGFLIIFFCCLPGGIVYFFYKPSGETRHVRMAKSQQKIIPRLTSLPGKTKRISFDNARWAMPFLSAMGQLRTTTCDWEFHGRTYARNESCADSPRIQLG